jgi:YbbR domain-containing protein
MLKNIANKIFTSRVFFVVFAVLSSIALWMYVEISRNQTRTVQIDDIPVVFLNEEILHDKGFIITLRDPETVTLEIEAPISVAPRLLRGNVTITVDLANIASRGLASRRYEIVYPPDINESDLTVTSRSVENISLFVDRLHSSHIPVSVSYNGGTASNEYIAELPIFDPQTVVARGPEELLSRVKTALVPILRENLSSTYTDDLEFILLDENGEELAPDVLSLITCDPQTINVTVPVMMMKTIPLTVNLAHGSGSTPDNTTYTVNPSAITVSGDPAALRELNSISLGTIDMTLFELTRPFPFTIPIPNGLVNLSGETSADVNVEVLGLEIKYLSTTNIIVTNKPTGLVETIITQSMDVRIRGKREVLDTITAQRIWIVADIASLGAGSARVPARVVIDGEAVDAGAVGTYQITVRLDADNGDN